MSFIFAITNEDLIKQTLLTKSMPKFLLEIGYIIHDHNCYFLYKSNPTIEEREELYAFIGKLQYTEYACLEQLEEDISPEERGDIGKFDLYVETKLSCFIGSVDV